MSKLFYTKDCGRGRHSECPLPSGCDCQCHKEAARAAKKAARQAFIDERGGVIASTISDDSTKRGEYAVVIMDDRSERILICVDSSYERADYENNQDAGYYASFCEPTAEEKQSAEYQTLVARHAAKKQEEIEATARAQRNSEDPDVRAIRAELDAAEGIIPDAPPAVTLEKLQQDVDVYQARAAWCEKNLPKDPEKRLLPAWADIRRALEADLQKLAEAQAALAAFQAEQSPEPPQHLGAAFALEAPVASKPSRFAPVPGGYAVAQQADGRWIVIIRGQIASRILKSGECRIRSYSCTSSARRFARQSAAKEVR